MPAISRRSRSAATRPPVASEIISTTLKGVAEAIFRMGSTFLSLHYHLVFATRNREPMIARVWRGRLHEYLGGTVRGLGAFSERVGGVDDHVHLLVGHKATHCLADFVRELKKASSVWVH